MLRKKTMCKQMSEAEITKQMALIATSDNISAIGYTNHALAW